MCGADDNDWEKVIITYEIYDKYGRSANITYELIDEILEDNELMDYEKTQKHYEVSKQLLRAKRFSEEFKFKKLLFEIDFEFEHDTEVPSEAVEHGIDDHVHDEIDGVMYHMNSDASISGKEGDLETWRRYEMDQQDNEFLVWNHDTYHGGDEVVVEEVVEDKGRPMKRRRVNGEDMDEAAIEDEGEC
ncbi:hypothetical protein Tco_1447093 [Tanacetum coccineum]